MLIRLWNLKQIVTNEFTILKSWNILFFFNYHCHIQDDRGQESQVKYGCCSLKHDNDDLDEDDRDDGNDMMCNIVIHSGYGYHYFTLQHFFIFILYASLLYQQINVWVSVIGVSKRMCECENRILLAYYLVCDNEFSWGSFKSVKRVGDINALIICFVI